MSISTIFILKFIVFPIYFIRKNSKLCCGLVVFVAGVILVGYLLFSGKIGQLLIRVFSVPGWSSTQSIVFNHVYFETLAFQKANS